MKEKNLKRKRSVNMRISVPILEKLAGIQKCVHKKNRTQAIVFSVDVVEIIREAVKNGGRIYIEHPDESREYVKFIF